MTVTPKCFVKSQAKYVRKFRSKVSHLYQCFPNQCDHEEHSGPCYRFSAYLRSTKSESPGKWPENLYFIKYWVWVIDFSIFKIQAQLDILQLHGYYGPIPIVKAHSTAFPEGWQQNGISGSQETIAPVCLTRWCCQRQSSEVSCTLILFSRNSKQRIRNSLDYNVPPQITYLNPNPHVKCLVLYFSGFNLSSTTYWWLKFSTSCNFLEWILNT